MPKRGEVNTYEEIINRWKTQNEGNIFSNCLKKKITQDHLGGIIMQPSKVAEVKNTGYFDGYINRIWSEFRTKDIHVNMGDQLGVWRGRVNGNNPQHTTDNVKSVYSDTYTSLVPGMFIGSWHQQTATQSVSLDGNNTLKNSNFNYVGIEFGGSEIDATDMEYLHLDIYPLSSFTINVYPICRNNDESVNDHLKKPINLIANQWNRIDIPMSDFVGLNASRIFQFKFDNGKGETFYLDNLYFYKNGSSNGISSIETHKQDNHAWYNLQGQRMNDGAGSLPKGVYIHNGKKILVK